MPSCFNCKGRSNVTNEEFVRSEREKHDSITNDNNKDQHDRSILFNYSFHKGHSLVYDMPILFRMAKYVPMEYVYFMASLVQTFDYYFHV